MRALDISIGLQIALISLLVRAVTKTFKTSPISINHWMLSRSCDILHTYRVTLGYADPISTPQEAYVNTVIKLIDSASN